MFGRLPVTSQCQGSTPAAQPRCDGLAEVSRKLRVLDLFSGIGGFSLGLERTGGFETVAFCEIEPFPRRVLAKHWPEVPCYHDVRTLTADVLARDGIAVDVITGGFPCQDISHAGHQRGVEGGTRSGLYREVIRLLGEIRPRFAVLENVAALLSGPSHKPGGWLGRILGDLAAVGYDAEWHRIRAGTIGLPQERSRVWLLAYPNGIGREAPILKAALANQAGSFRGWEQVEFYGTRGGNTRWFPASRPWRVDHGVPSELDIARTRAVGNAVVPQIPELIGRAILEAERAQ
jgi:DNA (cytosine-5)-methyltransferase 1